MKNHFRDLKQLQTQMLSEMTDTVNSRVWDYFETDVHKLTDEQMMELNDFIDEIDISDVPLMKVFFDLYRHSLS